MRHGGHIADLEEGVGLRAGVLRSWHFENLLGLRAREQHERVHMARAERPEVSLIKRGELRLVKPLDDREYSRVHEPNVGIVVAIAKGADTSVVDRLQILNLVGPRLDVVEKRNEHAGV